MLPIAETILTATAGNVSFASIPQTYRHLKLLINARSTNAVAAADTFIRVSGDSGTTSYQYQRLVAAGTALSAFGSDTTNNIMGPPLPGANAPAGAAGGAVLIFPNYARVGFHKDIVIRSYRRFGTVDADQDVSVRGGQWLKTAAIDSITVFANGGLFDIGSVFTLYGLS